MHLVDQQDGAHKTSRFNGVSAIGPLSSSFMGIDTIDKTPLPSSKRGRVSVFNQHVKDTKNRVQAQKAPNVTHIVQNPSNVDFKDWHT
jgi:hypothetical protein